MNYGDRRHIDDCINEIISKIDMCVLWPRLLENKVYYKEDVNVPKWENKLNQSEVAWEILDTVKTRGPEAYKKLLLCLRETGHDQAVNILESRSVTSNENQANNNSSGTTDSTSEENECYFESKFYQGFEPLVIDVKHATQFMDEAGTSNVLKYRMRKRPHGYVLIITVKAYIHEPVRNAAEHDQDNLKKLFTDMGFEVFVPDIRTNFTGAEINRIVREFSKRNFDRVDSCFVIISAHGDAVEEEGVWKNQIHGIDYCSDAAEKVWCADLIEMFTSENCSQLIGKPKVFIFQACRGPAQQFTSRTVSDGCGAGQGPRNYTDVIIANSTILGHKAYRDEYNGSWYIQILCQVFMEHAWNTHIVDLFNMVDAKLKRLRTLDNRAQTSNLELIGVSQHLYLNPGLFDDP